MTPLNDSIIRGLVAAAFTMITACSSSTADSGASSSGTSGSAGSSSGGAAASGSSGSSGSAATSGSSGAGSDGGGTDAGSTGDAGGDAKADGGDEPCGKAGDLGNSKGVGKYCKGILDCLGNKEAQLCAVAGDPKATFCTKLCSKGDGVAVCGENTTCVCDPGGGGQCGCTPTSCL